MLTFRMFATIYYGRLMKCQMKVQGSYNSFSRENKFIHQIINKPCCKVGAVVAQCKKPHSCNRSSVLITFSEETSNFCLYIYDLADMSVTRPNTTVPMSLCKMQILPTQLFIICTDELTGRVSHWAQLQKDSNCDSY